MYIYYTILYYTIRPEILKIYNTGIMRLRPKSYNIVFKSFRVVVVVVVVEEKNIQ